MDGGDKEKFNMKEWKENGYGLKGRFKIERRTKKPQSKKLHKKKERETKTRATDHQTEGDSSGDCQ